MRELLRLALACAVSAGTVLAIQGLRPPAAPRAAVAAAPATDEALLARLDELERRLATPPAEPEPPVAAPPVVDDARIERLEREIEALKSRPVEQPRDEDPRFKNLDDAQLRAHAVELSREPGLEAIDAWYTLLRRDLPPDQRAEALDGVADVHWKLKDYASAANAWGAALEVEGVRGTQRAQGLLHSRGWALLYSGNPQRALKEMDQLLAEPGLTESVESSARLAAASWAYGSGDAERARNEYQAVIDRWSRSPHEALRQRAESASRAMANLKLR
jgi:tetratricopeptide (TPR) repeat protein